MNLPIPVSDIQYQALALAPQYSSQCGLNAASQSQATYLGLTLFFITIGSLCLGRWIKNQCEQQATTDRHQQIELLERIWKMTTQQDFRD